LKLVATRNTVSSVYCYEFWQSSLDKPTMNMEPPPPIAAPPAPRKNSALAIWSLILGILSLTCFWLLSAIPAVICGHLAYSRIKRSGGTLEGSGLALGGLITGYISIALSIFMIPLLAAIAIPNLVKAREVAQMNACRNNLRQIEGAKQVWALEHKKEQTDSPTAEDLSAYVKNGFHSLMCPAGGTYSINAVNESPTCSIPKHTLGE
jgi:competence protein ComGC